MRNIILYTASSIDGFIASPNGSVDWLADPDNPEPSLNDYGYLDFLAQIDTTLMGHKTYQEILGFGGPFPYPDKENYVFSRHHTKNDQNPVSYISENIVEFCTQLKEKPGKDIWLVGGGQINALLLNAGLIDRMIISFVPVVLGTGIPLFSGEAIMQRFKIMEVSTIRSYITQCIYQRSTK